MQIILESVNDFAVLKFYICFLVEATENLEIKHIFSHCDEAVYSKLFQTIWEHGDEFSKVIALMVAFHQVLCLQKTIYKHYACLELDKWITDAITTKSSLAAEKSVHGLHYNTSICVYKKIFDAIVRMQMEDITNMYVNIDEELLNKLIKLRKSICSKNVNKIVGIEKFQILQKNITVVTGIQSQMVVMLLKDISLLLLFIAAAHETNINLHLQCERPFLKMAHVFDDINYSHCGTYQRTYLSNMKQKMIPAYKELKTVGFTAS